MLKLSVTNLFDPRTFRPVDALSIIGLAALWTSLFKRLVYPVGYIYYRTGNADILQAQLIYAIVLVVFAFTLIMLREFIAKRLAAYRWITAVLGVVGACGFAMLQSDLTAINAATVVTMSSVFTALYLPAHFAFWLLYLLKRDPHAMKRILLWSFVLFLAMYLVLELAGVQTLAVSALCPLVSTAAALALPLHASAPATALGAAAESEIAVSPLGMPEHTVETAHPYKSDDDTPGPGIPVQAPISATEHNAKASDTWIHGSEPSGAPTGNEAFVPIDPAIERFADEFGLSEREAELASYTYRNYSARKIARELFIAESTVYTHQKRIYRKTGVHSKQELIELIDTWKEESEQPQV